MKNNFVIRKAKISDLNDILRLNFDLFKKEYKEYDKSLNLKWTYNEGKKYFKARITKNNGFVEVVENKNYIVGYLCGGIIKGLFYRRKAKYAELENMFIDYRGKGLGAKLAEDFIIWCKENKADYISLTAFAKNEQALGLYRKLGFEDYNLSLEMKLTK